MRFRERVVASAALGVVFLSSGAVAFARVPNDPYFPDQWYLETIRAPEAWDTTAGSREVIVAVLDTGVDLDHPDLAANLWKNTTEVPGNGSDDDANGYIDDVDGWDFVDHDANPMPTDASAGPGASSAALSHGTLIAGVIGAQTNNALGYAGVNWQVRVMPLRILDEEGGGSEEEAIAAIRYAVRNGADVINLSFVGDESGSALRQAVADAYHAGVVIVAALGNEARDVNTFPVYPACYQSAEEDWVIGVAASDETDTETDFTNYGSDCADLSAPGTDVAGLGFSDGSLGLTGPQPSWSGTSTASPMVAGAAALLLGVYPSLTPDLVRTALKLSVDPVFTLSGPGALGVGRLNIERALIVAASLAGTEEEAPKGTPTEPESVNGSAELSFIGLGAPSGEEPWVRVFRADGTPHADFLAFGVGFHGGVRVVMDDLDGDGTPEVIAGAGPGGGPQVRVFTATGALIHSFFAYDETSRKGVSVALGDMNGDFVQDIVTVVGAGVSSDVVVYGQEGGELYRFPVQGFAADVPLTLTVADVDDDYDAEIVVGALRGVPRVAIYDNDGTPIVEFLAYAETMHAGFTLAAGDFDGDDRDEIVTAPNAPGSAHIRIFNKIGALWGQFFGDGNLDAAGAVVAVTDIDVDGADDIVIAPEMGPGDVRVFTPRGSLMGSIGQGLVGNLGTTLGAW